ncbi:hypothetical protein D3C85_1147150 [compost metagenome]
MIRCSGIGYHIFCSHNPRARKGVAYLNVTGSCTCFNTIWKSNETTFCNQVITIGRLKHTVVIKIHYGYVCIGFGSNYGCLFCRFISLSPDYNVLITQRANRRNWVVCTITTGLWCIYVNTRIHYRRTRCFYQTTHGSLQNITLTCV